MKVKWIGPTGDTPGIGFTRPDDVFDLDERWARSLIAQGVAEEVVKPRAAHKEVV